MSPRAQRLLGAAAVACSVLYVVTDLVEVAQGGFSPAQLWLTLVAEAAIPAIVLGLALVQAPRLSRVGWAGAWAYAYAYVFFTGTVAYALLNDTPDYAALSADLGPWMVGHGVLMVAGGIAFGAATLKARVLPAWPAWALMVGVVLVAGSQGLPDGVQAALAGIRALGFAGMGLALLRHPVEHGAPTS